MAASWLGPCPESEFGISGLADAGSESTDWAPYAEFLQIDNYLPPHPRLAPVAESVGTRADLEDLDIEGVAASEEANLLTSVHGANIRKPRLQNRRLFAAREKVCSGVLYTDHDDLMGRLTRNPSALGFASIELRSDRECVHVAVSVDGCALEFVAPHLKADVGIVLSAVQQSGHALRHAASELLAHYDIVMQAVTRNGAALQYADPSLQNDKEIVLIAVAQCPASFQYASHEIRKSISFIQPLITITKDTRILMYADPSVYESAELMLCATSINAYTVSLASPVLLGDSEFIFKAVSANVDVMYVMKYVDVNIVRKSFWDDVVFMTRLVALCPSAFALAGSRVCADRNLVLTAVSQDGELLQHAPPHLKQDREVVLAALQDNVIALRYVSDDLRQSENFKVMARNHRLFFREHTLAYFSSPNLTDEERTLLRDLMQITTYAGPHPGQLQQPKLPGKERNREFRDNRYQHQFRHMVSVTCQGLAYDFLGVNGSTPTTVAPSPLSKSKNRRRLGERRNAMANIFD